MVVKYMNDVLITFKACVRLRFANRTYGQARADSLKANIDLVESRPTLSFCYNGKFKALKALQCFLFDLHVFSLISYMFHGNVVHILLKASHLRLICH
jgi:hypothetical protein